MTETSRPPSRPHVDTMLPKIEFLAAAGFPTKIIAEALGMTPETVKRKRTGLGMPGRKNIPKGERERLTVALAQEQLETAVLGEGQTGGIFPAGMTYERAFQIALAAHDKRARVKPTDPRDDTDLDILRLNAAGQNDTDIARAVGLSSTAVLKRRARMKLPSRWLATATSNTTQGETND